MSEALLKRLPASPDVCVQKIDLTRDAALLVQFSQDAYRNASFLDDRILGPATQGGWAPRNRVIEAARQVQNPRPLHFIFHTGHVGSTLLSRLLDETGIVLSLREPLALRNLADARDVANLPEALLGPGQLNELQGALLQLWQRGYDNVHGVVLKATSSVGRIAAPLLNQRTGSRAVYLNLAAEPYLATLLAGRNSLIDLRGHGAVRIRSLQSRLSGAPTPLHRLSLGEFAAMSWLAESWNQYEAARLSGARVMTLDFDEFLSDVAAGIQRVVRHFELPVDDGQVTRMARSPVLTRYSKSPDFEYSPQVRAELLRQSRAQNDEEIRRGLRWLEELARSQSAVATILHAQPGAGAEQKVTQ
jgi:hypothetical protein